MKIQNTNLTRLLAQAKDNAWAVAELVADGMGIDDAVEAQVYGWMQDPYDETEFDAPYGIEQIKPIIKRAVIEYMEAAG